MSRDGRELDRGCIHPSRLFLGNLISVCYEGYVDGCKEPISRLNVHPHFFLVQKAAKKVLEESLRNSCKNAGNLKSEPFSKYYFSLRPGSHGDDEGAIKR
jgi:hypothetical protein